MFSGLLRLSMTDRTASVLVSWLRWKSFFGIEWKISFTIAL